MESKPVEINNYEDVVSYLGEEECKEPDYSSFSKEDREHEQASFRLKKAIKALNKLKNDGVEWKPDRDNTNQWKWFPVFRGSAFVFLDSHTHSDGTRSGVGSRFEYIDEETSDKGAKIFIELYKTYLLK